MTVMNIIKLNKIDLSTFITIPEVIKQKQQTNSNGFLMGVLNLTIESAPTNPRERAIDDFIIVIISTIDKPSIGKTIKFECLNSALKLNFLYTKAKLKKIVNPIRSFKIN